MQVMVMMVILLMMTFVFACSGDSACSGDGELMMIEGGEEEEGWQQSPG